MIVEKFENMEEDKEEGKKVEWKGKRGEEVHFGWR